MGEGAWDANFILVLTQSFGNTGESGQHVERASRTLGSRVPLDASETAHLSNNSLQNPTKAP